MKPKDYKEQDCCATCGHVFVKTTCEDDDSHYCHIDESNRPVCGSDSMDGEDFTPDHKHNRELLERVIKLENNNHSLLQESSFFSHFSEDKK